MIQLHCGNSLDVLATLRDDSIDSIVTDPPYGLSFMGRKWDYDVPSVDIWVECLRVLKPGGHLLAFAGTRTQHRMAVNIEDAGFDIRDLIAWVYGSGFPKSLDVSKAIDKAAGAEREVVGEKGGRYASPKQDFRGGKHHAASGVGSAMFNQITAPATPEAQQWDGWGTALKPALEPITVARKPFKGTVANNVLTHGTGALNIDECRVEGRERTNYGLKNSTRRQGNTYGEPTASADFDASKGRWPANLIHDGSDEVTELTGDAARFFYVPKCNKKDREDGNSHPTVKPTDLMAYLCRLVTPPEGIVLDPFMGSGSTGKAAVREGFSFIGIEREEEYVAIALKRLQVIQRSILASRSADQNG